MDANSGEPWSEMDIKDLRASLHFGNTYADAASITIRSTKIVPSSHRPKPCASPFTG